VYSTVVGEGRRVRRCGVVVNIALTIDAKCRSKYCLEFEVTKSRREICWSLSADKSFQVPRLSKPSSTYYERHS
jgi:hypothetical protein